MINTLIQSNVVKTSAPIFSFFSNLDLSIRIFKPDKPMSFEKSSSKVGSMSEAQWLVRRQPLLAIFHVGLVKSNVKIIGKDLLTK